MILSRKSALAYAFVSLLISGCGGGGDGGGGSTTVVHRTETIAEGSTLSLSLPAGTYHAEITASNNGVDVTWVGGSGCLSSHESKVYTASCVLPIAGQLTILNYSLLGLGSAEVTTINVTRD